MNKYIYLHPELITKIKYTIVVARQDNLPVDIFCGFRPPEEQHEYFLKGRDEKGNIIDKRKIITYADAWESWHNYGLAADIVFYINGEWNWDLDLYWNKLGQIGKEAGLTWGGDFTKFKDRPHFQFNIGLTIRQAKEILNEGGHKKVWEEITRREKNRSY